METLIIWYLGLMAIFLMFLIFSMIRNHYVFIWQIRANGAIHRFLQDKIRNQEFTYDMLKYYDIVTVDYNKHFWSVTRWGKYSAIKDEYRDIFQQFMD